MFLYKVLTRVADETVASVLHAESDEVACALALRFFGGALLEVQRDGKTIRCRPETMTVKEQPASITLLGPRRVSSATQLGALVARISASVARFRPGWIPHFPRSGLRA